MAAGVPDLGGAIFDIGVIHIASGSDKIPECMIAIRSLQMYEMQV